MRLDPRTDRHAGDRIGRHRADAEVLFDNLIEAGDGGGAAGQNDLVDAGVIAAGIEELQQTRNLLRDAFLERLEHFGFIAFRQTAEFLGGPGLTEAQTVRRMISSDSCLPPKTCSRE